MPQSPIHYIFLLTLLGALISDAHGAPDALSALGERLFSETRLSADGTISCASCHDPVRGFSDGTAVAVGVGGRVGVRNTPGLIGVFDASPLFWDGRHDDLLELVLEPLLNPREHGLRDRAELESRLRSLRYLRAYVARNATNEDATYTDIALQAIAAFLRTLKPSASALQRLRENLRDDAPASPESLGAQLFVGRAGCAACHRLAIDEATLTDFEFHDHGIAQRSLAHRLPDVMKRWWSERHEMPASSAPEDAESAALGRFRVTGLPADIGKFRTPPLWNVGLTAPYMHDGSIATLEDAIAHEIYYSAKDRGAGLSHEDRQALAAFLRSL